MVVGTLCGYRNNRDDQGWRDGPFDGPEMCIRDRMIAGNSVANSKGKKTDIYQLVLEWKTLIL